MGAHEPGGGSLTPYFDHLEMIALCDAIVSANHVDDGVWKAALAPLLPRYRSSLPPESSGAAVSIALSRMNQTERLIDGTIPLEIVLLVLQARTSEARLAQLVDRLLPKLRAKIGELDAAGQPVAYVAAKPEAYTGAIDRTLPVDFLVGGAAAARAVVKLVVPRYQDGQPVVDAFGQRQLHVGTGWLVARDLLFTNFHVIAARQPYEAEPSVDDLARQIGATSVILHHDRDDRPGVSTQLTGGVALGDRRSDKDYALLRIAPLDDWPAPLRLCFAAVTPLAGFAVNVIHHPEGLPKRVSVRSNLLKAVTTTELSYFSDTLSGSSGAPLCNDAWQVIGLHRAAGPATGVKVNGRDGATWNLGVPMGAILADLAANAPAAHAELARAMQP